jgi:cytochrome c oxidase assembly protein subunit 15
MPKISGSLARLAGVTALLVYVQLVLGSLLRHVPTGTGPLAFRMAVWAHLLMAAVVSVHIILLATKSWRVERGNGRLIRPVYGMAGLLIAQLSLGVGTWVVKYGWPAWFANSWIANASWAPSGSLLSFTVTAGSRLQAWITTLHVAIGSLILATAVMTTLRMARAACRAGEVPDAASSQTSLNSGTKSDQESPSDVERPMAELQVLEAVA